MEHPRTNPIHGGPAVEAWKQERGAWHQDVGGRSFEFFELLGGAYVAQTCSSIPHICSIGLGAPAGVFTLFKCMLKQQRLSTKFHGIVGEIFMTTLVWRTVSRTIASDAYQFSFSRVEQSY